MSLLQCTRRIATEVVLLISTEDKVVQTAAEATRQYYAKLTDMDRTHRAEMHGPHAEAAYAIMKTAMEQMTEAIDTQMERLGVLERLDDQEGVMETLADLAHPHATIGEVDLASDHLNRSLQLAKDMGDLSGQLVAAWGLADVAEIAEDWSTAMLHLSDVVHAFMAVGIPAPEQVRERIKALTDLADRA